MSDYPNTNIHRGQGISGRGLLITAVVLILAIFALSFLGASTAPSGNIESAIEAAPVPID